MTTNATHNSSKAFTTSNTNFATPIDNNEDIEVTDEDAVKTRNKTKFFVIFASGDIEEFDSKVKAEKFLNSTSGDHGKFTIIRGYEIAPKAKVSLR